MKVCICDDRPIILEEIKNHIEEINDKYKIKLVDNTKDLEKELNKKDIDILFMDIKLDNVNGIEFIKKNNNYLKNTKLIYITGYTEYIEDIFETNPIYFLQKPITKDKIKKVLDKVDKLTSKDIASINIKASKEIIKLKIKDIYYFESNGRIVNIFLKNDTYKTYEKLSTFEDILGEKFLRIHKSFLVNINKITKYKNNKITLENGVILNISRTYTKHCRDTILKYLLGE